MRRWMIWSLCVVMVGCGGKDGEDTGGTAPVDTAIGGTVPSDAPVLRNCDAFCRLNEAVPGYAFFQWTVECIYEDPQGNDTVQAFGDLNVEQNGATLSTTTIVCGVREDGTPQCYGQYGADTVGASCQSDPESYAFIVTVYDIDGNSGTESIQGRAEG